MIDKLLNKSSQKTREKGRESSNSPKELEKIVIKMLLFNLSPHHHSLISI